MVDTVETIRQSRDQLEALKTKANQVNLKRARLEASLEHLRKQEREVLLACKNYDCNNSEELQALLTTELAVLQAALARVEQLTGGAMANDEAVDADDFTI